MTPCPDDETLAGFIEHRLTAPEHAEIERHIASCASCLDIVAAAIPAETGDDIGADEPVTETLRLPARPASTRRSWAHALAAGLALLVTGGLGYLATDVATEHARATAVRMATDRLGVVVEVEQVAISLAPDLRSISVHMIEVELGAFGRAAAAEVTLSLAPLPFGAPALQALRLFAPEFRWTLSRDDPERPRPDDVLAALALAPTVDVIDALLRVDRPDDPAIVIEHISATTRTMGKRVHLRATGALAGGTLSVDGTVDSEGLPELDVTVGGRDVPSALLPYVRDWTHGRATLVLRGTGDPSNLRWAGRLRVADASLRDVSPLRDLAAVLRIDPGQLSGSADHTTDLRATFRIDQAGWRVPRCLLVQGHLETRAMLRSADGVHVTGAGIARLPAGRSGALMTRHPLVGFLGTSRGLAFPFRLQGRPGRVEFVPEW